MLTSQPIDANITADPAAIRSEVFSSLDPFSWIPTRAAVAAWIYMNQSSICFNMLCFLMSVGCGFRNRKSSLSLCERASERGASCCGNQVHEPPGLFLCYVITLLLLPTEPWHNTDDDIYSELKIPLWVRASLKNIAGVGFAAFLVFAAVLLLKYSESFWIIVFISFHAWV